MLSRSNSSYLSDVGRVGVHIHEEVYASLREDIHASIMVSRGVDMVHADRISTQLLHQGCVELALLGIDKRIVLSELIGNPCWRYSSIHSTMRKTSMD